MNRNSFMKLFIWFFLLVSCFPLLGQGAGYDLEREETFLPMDNNYFLK